MNYYAPDDYALVIGINDYPNWNKGEKSLRGPIRDAIGFHKWLTDPLGGGVPPANAHLITSVTKPLAPLQSGIDDFFSQVRELSEGKDRRRFYFYFSGHGHSPAGSFQRQCLCLPNWSPQLAGAALDVDSYVKAAIGCLKFSEALFFLDCCRVRQVAPLGKPSDLECGDPQVENRNYAIVFASDHYKPGLEGVVDGEVQGYFTAAMLRILDKETIELNDLVTRLKVDVPALARPRDQTVRSLPTDKKIYLGPPDRKPPTAEPIPQVYEDRTIARLAPTPEGGERVVASVIRMLVDETHNLTVNVRSALRRLSSSEELEAPAHHSARHDDQGAHERKFRRSASCRRLPDPHRARRSHRHAQPETNRRYRRHLRSAKARFCGPALRHVGGE
ncbi:caspase family protein [Bradyrhizobium sp. 200]|uniref:caspase family protein n=1 Tax=Bradyrhizobium sp. 200 TaxID=2782665 RepID=UPI001FFE53A6|nr:caspase family protein [Bradyrhizobium sp. 200]UPJ49274.1 caspase family protein [Bradyrhizobium sp. 200]